MKKKSIRFAEIGGFATAALVLLLAVSGSAQARDAFSDDAFSTYEPNVANGEYMAKAAGCLACHASGEDLTLLSGGREIETYVGKFFVPNITASSSGTGGWSNAQYLNAVINGTAPDGRNYYPVFPYNAYAGMKPEDVLDIKAYIETLKPSDSPSKRHEVSFPYNLDSSISAWKMANFDTPAFQPGDGSQMSRGRYLVENVGACGECHTPRTLTYGLDEENALSGNKGVDGEVAPDISVSKMAGLGDASVFVTNFIDKEQKLSGSPVTSPLKRAMLEGYKTLTQDDRRAILAYLSGRPQKTPDIAQASCSQASAQPLTLDSDVAAKADDFVGRYCRNCHGLGESNEGSFPAGDLNSIARNPAFVTPGNRASSLLFTSVSSGRMPYGTKPSADEIEALGAWIDGLDRAQVSAKVAPPPRNRPIIGWRSHVENALRDLTDIDERDRPFIRYFSFQQLYNGVFPCESEADFARRLDLFQAGFRKLVNSVSLGERVVNPQPVEGTGDRVLRVDIRDFKWSESQWDQLVADYPYGYAPENDPSLTTLARETTTRLPIIRADWFMANASRPEIYAVLLDLPDNVEALERRIGVDAARNIHDLKVIRGAFTEGFSGVSDHNRLLERHDSLSGYYWKSYDFIGSSGIHSLKLHPHGPRDIGQLPDGLEPFTHDGGEMLFTLPNGLQGYYLTDGVGKRIDRGPTTVVSFRQRPIGKGVEIINGRSCMTCHADGTIAKRDQLRTHIESSTLFNLDQRETLLRMYVDQIELDKAYAEDRDLFISALSKINATEKAPDGSLKSISGAGGEEIITWFADFYEADMDENMLAAEFDMTLDEFKEAIQRVRDPMSRAVAIDWINQLEAGIKVSRSEVEDQFPNLVKAVMNLEPLRLQGAEPELLASAQLPLYKTASYRDDGYDATPGTAAALKLSIMVDKTNVLVGERLTFDVVANQACELQILYVEADGNVELIPQAMIGDPFLQPGVPRTIPDASVGELVFDTPAEDETLVLNCKVGGLGSSRMSAEEARAIIASSFQPPKRGLAVKMFENNAKAVLQSAKEPSLAAINMLSFNVREHE
ncbi:c-type cytochrome [Rhizobium sp. L1K21]|uniref:c-type cytochrome n=1 Tax=Rhizobium sp. L1K21 TaxID=2954933 RepID=UPI0020930AC7|nr:DUF4384 domain-containing protein [Rhizobium sp. L1K21]